MAIDSPSEKSPVAGKNFQEDAAELVKRASAFSDQGTFQTAKAFADEWQGIVAQGKDYSDQVASAAAKIANDSWSKFVPDAEVGKDRFGGYLGFNSTAIGHVLGSRGADLEATDDGRVVAWPHPFKLGQRGVDYVAFDHWTFHAKNGKEKRPAVGGTEIGSDRWLARYAPVM